MSKINNQLEAVISPFVERGLFESPEQAVYEMALDYILHQIERYKEKIKGFEQKYGMSFDDFELYLRSRSIYLTHNPNQDLSQAVMIEEDDAFDWKVASEMLANWLGVQPVKNP